MSSGTESGSRFRFPIEGEPGNRFRGTTGTFPGTIRSPTRPRLTEPQRELAAAMLFRADHALSRGDFDKTERWCRAAWQVVTGGENVEP